jgi:hypothetical protein
MAQNYTPNAFPYIVCTETGASNTPIPRTRLQKVNRPKYSFVLDLNGFLIHRSYSPKSYSLRKGCIEFMDWLFANANVIVWSCTVKKNIYAMLDGVLKEASFKTSDIQVLS